jgi:hypothetical protein
MLLELLTVELKLILNMLVLILFLVTLDVYNLFIIVTLHVCICTFLLYSSNHFHGTSKLVIACNNKTTYVLIIGSLVVKFNSVTLFHFYHIVLIFLR